MNTGQWMKSYSFFQKSWIKCLFSFFVMILVLFSAYSFFPAGAIAETTIDNANLIVVAGKIQIKSSQKEKFIELAEKCLIPSRKEPGSLSYSFYEDQTQPNTFLYFEEWRDQAALDYHFQTPYFKEFIAQASDLFVSPPEIKVYEISRAKTL